MSCAHCGELVSSVNGPVRSKRVFICNLLYRWMLRWFAAAWPRDGLLPVGIGRRHAAPGNHGAPTCAPVGTIADPGGHRQMPLACRAGSPSWRGMGTSVPLPQAAVWIPCRSPRPRSPTGDPVWTSGREAAPSSGAENHTGPLATHELSDRLFRQGALSSSDTPAADVPAGHWCEKACPDHRTAVCSPDLSNRRRPRTGTRHRGLPCASGMPRVQAPGLAGSADKVASVMLLPALPNTE